MRLTLRTLLAYLDDILEPSQTKEIGEKLHESSYASSLVSRIREVMRRRRLSAPTLSGPGVGIDPNTVAEYLDNTLPPDGVADVEKICLESDMHLAEAAACHQILALALGEPVEIPQRMRERMYGLGPSAEKLAVSEKAAAIGASSPELGSEAVAQVLAQAEPVHKSNGQSRAAAEGGRSFREGLPDVLKPRSAAGKIIAYVVAAAALLGWAYVTIMNSPFRPKETNKAVALANANLPQTELGPALGPQNATDIGQAAASPNRLIADATAPDERNIGTTTGDSGAEAGNLSTPDPRRAEKINAVGPDELEEPAPYRKAAVAAKESTTEDVTKAAQDETLPTEQSQPRLVAAPSINYVSKEGAVLYLDTTEQSWFRMQSRAQVRTLDRLAVPDPFDATFEIDSGRALLTVLPRSALQWMPPGETWGFGIDLARGQAVVRAASAADATGKADQPVALAVVLAGELWHLALAPGAICGVEAIPPEPSKFEQEPPASAWLAAIYVAAESVTVTRAGQHPYSTRLEAPDWLQVPLTPSLPNDPASPPLPSDPLRQMPKWLSATKGGSPSKSLVTIVERELVYNQPVVHSLPAVVKNPNPMLSEWAASTLGLIEDVDSLVEILRGARHEEARAAATAGLRAWLPRQAGNRETLKTSLGKHYPPAEAELVYKLLWGVDEEDLRTKEYSRDLIDLMSANDPSIRSLAFLHVKRLTHKDFGYRPNASETQRASALKQWRQQLERNEGALLPPARPRQAAPLKGQGSGG
jgi:hypothetical protein